jgi:hypothetical protein
MPLSANSVAQQKALWHMRESMSDAQKPEGGSIKHDVLRSGLEHPAVHGGGGRGNHGRHNPVPASAHSGI